MSIWFRHLLTDGQVLAQPDLKNKPFVLIMPERGRMVIQSVNALAEREGICPGMVLADARALFPSLAVLNSNPGHAIRLLNKLAEWCLRYTPEVGIQNPDGLILHITGCPHLWGGERSYLKDVVLRLRAMGYDNRAAIADTIGAAWANARYGKVSPIIETGREKNALLPLPPAALRLEQTTTDRLAKLGLHTIGSFIDMPRSNLRRRFGLEMLTRIDQALDNRLEQIQSICPLVPYQERLPCLDPIRSAMGITIAIKRLLDRLYERLCGEGKGLRLATLTCYRIDHQIQQIRITTTRTSRDVGHLFKLFELKISSIEPALGIELFVLEANLTESMTANQEALWRASRHNEKDIAQLMDRIAGKIGSDKIHRYLPDEHHLPERSFRKTEDLNEKPAFAWRTDYLRPVCLLTKPEKITVSVRQPDFPPMLFVYKGQPHRVTRADGPERIEQEWWLADGLYRDYYCVEDTAGAKYWLFRSGHFDHEQSAWYLHGFFA